MKYFDEIVWRNILVGNVVSSNNLSVSRIVDAHESQYTYFVKTIVGESEIPKSVLVNQFRRSFRIMRRLMHPGVLRPIAMIDQLDKMAILYPYMNSDEWRPLNCASLSKNPKKLLIQIAGIIDFLHLRGLVHRDIKLENFLMNDESDIILIDPDFVCDEGESHVALLFGTPELLPPTTNHSLKINRIVDIFSLGKSIKLALLANHEDGSSKVHFRELEEMANSLMNADVASTSSVLSIMKEHFTFSEGAIMKYGRILLRSHIKSSIREQYSKHNTLGEALCKALSPSSGVTGLMPRLERTLADTKTDWKSVKRWLRWVETLPISLKPTHVHCNTTLESLLAAPFFKQPSLKPMATVGQIRKLKRDCSGNPLKTLLATTLFLSDIEKHDSPIEYLLRIVRYKSLRHLQLRTEAIHELEVILKLSVTNSTRRSRIILQLAKLNVSAGNYYRALTLSEEHETVLMSRHDLEMSLVTVWATYMIGNINEAVSGLNQLSKTSEALSHRRVSLVCIYYKAVFQFFGDDNRSALETLSTHRDHGSSLFPEILYLIKTQQSIIACNNGSYLTAFELVVEAIGERPVTTTTSIAPSYLTLATSCMMLGKFKEALSYLDTFLSLSSISNVDRGYLNYSWAMGWLLQEKGQIERALLWFLRSHNIATTSNTKGLILINVAGVYLQQGDASRFSETCVNISSIETIADDQNCMLELEAVTLTWKALYDDSRDVQELLNHAELLASKDHVYASATCLFHAIVSQSTPTVLIRAKEVWESCRNRVELNECPMYLIVDSLISHSDQIEASLETLRIATNSLSPHYLGLFIMHIAEAHRDRGNTPAQIAYAKQAHSMFSSMNNTLLTYKAESLMRSSDSINNLTLHYNTICDILQEVNEEESMLDIFLGKIVEWTGAERAAIVLEREQNDDYYIPSYKNIHANDLSSIKEISMSIATNTILLQKPYVLEDAKSDPNSKLYRSVVKYDIRSVLSLPFTTSSQLKGTLYLSHHTLKSFFENSDLEFLRALARFVGVAISISRHQHEQLGDSVDTQRYSSHIVARDRKMLSLLSRINRLARKNLPILVTGERGVGKDLIARQIHANSERSRNSFKAINCASLSPQHLSSELFGVGSKAFSGVNKRLGAIRSVDGGTLFLDEIGDLSLEAQASLLRALEYQEITPLGSDKVIQTDVRFLYGTNQNLEEKIEQGSFRADFFDRIAVIEIKIPPLRERIADIDALIDHFSQLVDISLPDGSANISPQVRQALNSYTWPGNIRELQNTITYVSSLDFSGAIQLSHLPDKILGRVQKNLSKNDTEMSREFYRKILMAHDGNVAKVARVLDISYNTLRSRLKKNGLI